MSGSPKNIQRDGIWLSPETARQTWSITYPITNTTYAMNSDALVATDQASVISDPASQSLGLGLTTAVGIFIQQPVSDNQPYRIKASMGISALPDYNQNGMIIIGYAPASITGSDDLINVPKIICFKNTFDDLVYVDVPVTYADRPLAIMVAPLVGVALVNLNVLGQLSVQNLGVKPPTMQNAVS